MSAVETPHSPIFTLTKNFYDKRSPKQDKTKLKISILPQIFKRNKLQKKRFLSTESFVIQNSNFKRFKSAPDFNLDFLNNDRSKIYSDMYFRYKKSLFGYVKFLDDLVYSCNNVAIFNDENFNLGKNNFEYMPIYEFSNHERSHLKLLIDLSSDDAETMSRTFVENSNSFKTKIPLIQYNTYMEENSLFTEKSYGEKCNRVCTNYYFYRTKKKKVKQNLDEISPVENENITISTPKVVKKYPNKSLDEIEKILLEKKKLELQLQAERNIFLLEPLLLENIPSKRLENKITPSEHKKIVRFTIMYTLAFFALAIVTFFIIYLA